MQIFQDLCFFEVKTWSWRTEMWGFMERPWGRPIHVTHFQVCAHSKACKLKLTAVFRWFSSDSRSLNPKDPKIPLPMCQPWYVFRQQPLYSGHQSGFIHCCFDKNSCVKVNKFCCFIHDVWSWDCRNHNLLNLLNRIRSPKFSIPRKFTRHYVPSLIFRFMNFAHWALKSRPIFVHQKMRPIFVLEPPIL